MRWLCRGCSNRRLGIRRETESRGFVTVERDWNLEENADVVSGERKWKREIGLGCALSKFGKLI